MKTIFKRFMFALVALIATTGAWAEEVTIGEGTGETYYFPIDDYYNYSFTEQIYTAEEIGRAGIITKISFYYNYSEAFRSPNVTMYMKNVSRSVFASSDDYEPVTTADIVWTGDIAPAGAGWYTFTLDTPFEYNGTDNLLVAFFDGTYGYPGDDYTWRQTTSPNEASMALYYHSDTYRPNPYDLGNYDGSKYLYEYRANIKLDIVKGFDLTGTCDHGTMTFTVDGKEVTEAKPGQKVTVTIESEDGWRPDDIMVLPYANDWSGAQSRSAEPQAIPFQTIPTTRNGDAWTFTMPAMGVEVRATSSIVITPLTVTANSIDVGVGESAPRYTATYEGLTGSDTPADLDKLLTFTCDYTKGSPEGTYTITPSGLNLLKYDVTYVPGTLTASQHTYTAKDGVVYSVGQQNARVVGVLKGEYLPAATWGGVKSIQIADEVTANGKTVKVVDFSSDWMHAGEFRNAAVQGSTGTTPATNPGLDDGSDWDTTGGGGGQNPTGQVVYRTVEAATVAGYADEAKTEVNPLELILRASELTEITRSDIETDEAGTLLPIAAFIIGQDSGISDIPANMFAGSKGETTVVREYYAGTASPEASQAKLAEDQAAADAALNGSPDGSQKGAVAELAEAQAEKDAADQKVADAQEALDIATLKEKYPEMFSTEDVAKKTAAERLEAAIAAFAKNDGDQKGYWTALKKKVQAYTNVTEISPWFAGYTLATEGVAAVGVGAGYWQPLVDELKDAYADFYGKDITTVENDPVGDPVDGHAIEWIWVTGDVVEGNETVASGVGVDLTAADATQSGKFMLAPIPTALTELMPGVTPADYRMLREIVIAGDVSLRDAKFVKVEDIDGDLYYVVYKYNEDGGMVPYNKEDNSAKSYAVVKINPESEQFQVYTPKPAAELDIDACDPAGDIAEAKKGVMTVDEATEALNTALAGQTAAQTKLTAAQTKKDAAQARVDELAGVDPNQVTKEESTTVPVLDETKENKTLLLGAFNNAITRSIGHHAFYNCVNARFTGTFAPTISSIGEKAFANTRFEELNLNGTNTVDRNEDGKTNDGDRLTDAAIATDAFLNTPLKTMLLAGSNLSEEWVKAVANGIRFGKKEYTDKCGDKYERTVNETLTTVELPAAAAGLDGIDALECDKVLEGSFKNCVALEAIAFPAQIDAVEDDAFCGDDALAAITFAPEGSELLWIGNGAFYGAAATTIDLSAQKKLGHEDRVGGQIGDYAFAGMKNLTSVNLTDTRLKALPANIFSEDDKLAAVTFYNAADPESGSRMETLPAGLFKDNAIRVLDIARTCVTVLNNLFEAGNGSQKAKDCLGQEYVVNPVNTTLEAVKLPAWLREIRTNALAHMHNPAFTTVEVPGSVEELGEGVFGDDKYLEVVSFFNYENDPAKKDFLDGSMLEELPRKTFAQCPNLKQVYIVTYETLDNDYFGDNCFFSAGTSNTAEDARVEVYVNHDSYNALTGGTTVYSSTYSKLMAFETTLKGKKIGDEYFKPWTSKFGTWIEAVDEGENAVGVYTAYQDGHKIVLYPAKKSTFEGKSYYKIAAYDDDRAMAAISPVVPGGAGEIVIDPDNDEITYPSIGFVWTGSSIPRQIKALLEERLSFGSMGAWGEFDPSTDVLAKSWMAFGTAIIVSASDEVPYIQKTNEDQKYQSTLDLANQLSVAHVDIPRSDDTNWYYLAKSGDKPKFKHHNSDDNLEYILKGSVAFLQTSQQGKGTREFDIEILSEDEATSINGVVERSASDDAVYNLRGVRVDMPVKGQMYIKNGKKFIYK